MQSQAGRGIALSCLTTRAKLPGGGEPCHSHHHPPSRERHPSGSPSGSPTATSHGCSTHTGPDPANGPRGGGSPHAKRTGTPPLSSRQHTGLVPDKSHAFCRPACTERACLPRLLSSCWGVLFGFIFFFFPLLSLSWELIVHFQQQPGDPGDNSAATWPGTGTTWMRFRHLASHKEGGKQSGSIPSAPKANKLHRLTPAATKTCRNYLGCSRSHGDELLHVFLSVGRRFGIPLCLLP